MSYKLNASAVAAALVLASGYAGAADAESSIYSFSGFGTLGLVHSSEDRAEFKSSYSQREGAGYTHDWAFGVDSRLGGQVRADFDERWSAVLQVVTEQQADGRYTPHVEWFNVKYAVTSDLDIRVGRIALPTLLISESRKVGYTTPFVRPPLELYSMQTTTNSDGVDVSYGFGGAGWRNTVTVFTGKNKGKLGYASMPPVENEVTGIVGLVDTVKFGNLTVQVAQQRQKVTVKQYALFDASYKLTALGASYDAADWFVMGELASERLDWAKDYGAYVTGGYRCGDYMPYLAYAQRHSAIAGNRYPGSDQKSATAGLRWDFMKNADLKLQYEHARVGQNAAGSLLDPRPGFRLGATYGVVSATVDFVF